MADKLALTAALLLALVAFATATRYTTVVTTTVDEDDDVINPHQQQQQCQSQQYQGKQFNGCQRWMKGNPIRWQRGQQGGQQQQGDEPLLIETVNSQKGAEALTECCEEMRQVESECRCEAINHAVRQLNQELKQQEQQMPGGKEVRRQMKQMIRQRATEIPKICNFQEPQQCQIGRSRTIIF